MERLKLATVWLGGCSGCHMSFLDLDEWLIDLAQHGGHRLQPLVDVKEYPEGVDVVAGRRSGRQRGEPGDDPEGPRAQSSVADLVRRLRGDGQRDGAAQSAGLPMQVLRRSYLELADLDAQIPDEPGSCRSCSTACGRSMQSCRSISTCPAVRRRRPRIRAVLESVLAGETPQSWTGKRYPVRLTRSEGQAS